MRALDSSGPPAAKVMSDSREDRKRTRGEAEPTGAATPEWSPVEVVDRARTVYNRPCHKGPQLDEKGMDHTTAVVQAKTEAFCACFASSIRVRALGSGKDILPDARALRTRYQTVFRESGSGLRLRVLARAVFEHGRGGRRVMVLDREQHASLISPGGSTFDGTFGLRGPRDQGLWALYEIDRTERRVTAMWLCPAADGAPEAGEGDALADAPPRDYLAELRQTEHWGAFTAEVDRSLEGGWEVHSGPVHSVAVGCFEMQGRRPTMEDQVAIERIRAPQVSGRSGAPMCFIGVYDGHGGGACSRFAAERMHVQVQRPPPPPAEPRHISPAPHCATPRHSPRRLQLLRWQPAGPHLNGHPKAPTQPARSHYTPAQERP